MGMAWVSLNVVRCDVFQILPSLSLYVPSPVFSFIIKGTLNFLYPLGTGSGFLTLTLSSFWKQEEWAPCLRCIYLYFVLTFANSVADVCVCQRDVEVGGNSVSFMHICRPWCSSKGEIPVVALCNRHAENQSQLASVPVFLNGQLYGLLEHPV